MLFAVGGAFAQTATPSSAPSAASTWTSIGPGVEYRRFQGNNIDVHVTRIDLTNDQIRVVATRESERGLRVSDFARKTKAIAAINADYFDAQMNPIGLTIGPCGRWEGTKDTTREGVIAVGEGRARIDQQRDVMETPEKWIDTAVSGWPLLVRDCTALKAEELPGSKAFTHSPHPRTAIGSSRDGKTLYFVVADGRRENAPGMTLGQLAEFMDTELDVCSAMNFDGGGSSAMWAGDKLVSRPSDGSERRVADHLAVVRRSDVAACDTVVETKAAERRLAIKAEATAEAATPKSTATSAVTPATPKANTSNAPQ
jgi:exopolysaccharide biosynthesis protein